MERSGVSIWFFATADELMGAFIDHGDSKSLFLNCTDDIFILFQ